MLHTISPLQANRALILLKEAGFDYDICANCKFIVYFDKISGALFYNTLLAVSEDRPYITMNIYRDCTYKMRDSKNNTIAELDFSGNQDYVYLVIIEDQEDIFGTS